MLEEDEKYFHSKRFKRLLQRYETAMADTGSIYLEPDELTDIAEFYAMEDRMEQANKAIDLALALHPGSVDPQVFLARQQMFLDNMDEAYRICEAIADKDDREVLFLRAELLLHDGDVEGAQRFLMDIYQTLSKGDEPDLFLYDSAALLYDYGAWQQTVDMIETLRQQYDASQSAEKLYICSLLELGRTNDVVREAEEFLNKYPYDVAIWVAKGEAYAALDNLPMGLESAEFALAIEPENPHAQVLSGNCNFHLGNYEQALDIFTQYLSRYPDEASAHYLCALSLSALGRYAESLEETQRIDMTSPTLETMRDGIYLHRALTHAKLGHLDEALRDEALFEAEQDEPHTNHDLQKGYIYLYCNKMDEAMNYLRSGLMSLPPLQTAFDAPIQCIESEHVDEAIELLLLMDQLYANDKERERIAPMLAHCYYQVGNRPAFLHTFLRALQHEPELTADVFRIELPHTNDTEELLRSALMQIRNDVQ